MHWLGYIGTAIVIAAYLPQILHLVRERCSAGLSAGAYLMWAIASMLLLSYAVGARDPVFMALQTYQVSAAALICFFANKYRDSLCALHGGPTG